MPKPVYALVGADSFLQLDHLGAIARQLPADAQRADFEGETAELAAVLDELRSFSMFGGDTKLVVIRDADAFITRFREQLENYIEHPSESGVLVLRLNSLPSNQRIHKAIAKVGEVIPCAPPKGKDLINWVTRQAKSAHAVTISADAARLLVEMVGDDLGRLDSELAKLALLSDDGQVRDEQIMNGVSFQKEREMWELTNELSAGRRTEAVRRWRQLVQSDPSSEFRAVTWLAIWLNNVKSALAMKKQGMNAFTIAKTLRIWPSELQKPFFAMADALGDAGVARAIDLLTEVDRHSKSGVGEAATNVERFILTLPAGKLN